MARRMVVVAYQPKWPRQYAAEELLLRRALGNEIVRAHHIGSTAVPGLAAKPIIDILLEVRSVTRLDEMDHAMEELGYLPRGELGIPGRRYYSKGGDDRTHHVHAFATGDPHVEKHIAFRDYLRTHPLAAADYAAVKKRAARIHALNPEKYVAFKHNFVEQLVRQAVHWFRQQGCTE